MPEMNRANPEVVEDLDFDEEKDDFTEDLEKDTREDDLLDEKPQGIFSRIADKIKGFFKDIKDKITASIQQRVQERRELHDARVNSAYNKAVMGKDNYKDAVAAEYREAHRRGDVNLLKENEGHKPAPSRSSVEDMMRGKSAFDEVDKTKAPSEKAPTPTEKASSNETLPLFEGVVYDATVKRTIPDKNLMIVNVGGTEGRIHASQLPSDKPISDYKAGDTFEAVYIGQYNGQPSFSVTEIQKQKETVEKEIKADNEFNKIDKPSDKEANPFDTGLSEEEVNEVLFYGGEQLKAPSEPSAEEMSEIPPEAAESVSFTAEPVNYIDSGATNHICYDTNSFVDFTSTNKSRTVTLIGGKGSVELEATCDGTAWTFKNGNGKKISDEKAASILSQHKNIGDVEKAMSVYLLAKKDEFDKSKETSDRAESAFEPTVFHYKEKAVLVTHEGKAIEVAPMMRGDDTTKQAFKFNKNGIDSASKFAKATFTKENSLDKGEAQAEKNDEDKGDVIPEEENKESPYVSIDGYNEQGDNVSAEADLNNRNNQNREDPENDMGL